MPSWQIRDTKPIQRILLTMRFYSSFLGCILFLALGSVSLGQSITYNFTGEITVINTNTNNIVPNLNLGDSFSGFLNINSPELANTTSAELDTFSGTTATIFTSINGLDLNFDIPNVFGDASVAPGSFSFDFVGDQGGGASPLPTTTFSAANFGVSTLADTDGSAGITELFPNTFDLSQFEQNVFVISGTHVPSGNSIGLVGELTSFTTESVPEPSALGILGLGVLMLSRRRYRRSLA